MELSGGAGDGAWWRGRGWSLVEGQGMELSRGAGDGDQSRGRGWSSVEG